MWAGRSLRLHISDDMGFGYVNTAEHNLVFAIVSYVSVDGGLTSAVPFRLG